MSERSLPLIAWLAFFAFVVAMLALDLGVLHRSTRTVSMREAARWSAIWVGLAIGFDLLVWATLGAGPALDFATAYVIEKSLSVDNLFVFLVVFGALRIGPEHQHRVLFWGILGALVMRGAMIAAGLELLSRFHWLIYVFGGVLVVTGLKLLRGWYRGEDDEEAALENGRLFRFVRRWIPSTTSLHGGRFFVIENGRRVATPLLVALVLVELTDVVFALDSIPAVVAVSRDPFIVFTSNVFAILGLRNLYFLLAGAVEKLHHLKLGLSAVLVFVGAKMALVDVVSIPPLVSLAIVTTMLALPFVVGRARRA
ncbi:Integral membrane protein TerC [Sandaracinus amylolyticus]|uniref:Integral membrane protein TerC n=2 Tax=Sandaracinus amylolyticus TaxID=927083 RepID=A0A0F6YHE2_9BACT|nr:TerC family protein [Sandaracinus amylolyticus]AKF04982.1 Integral membrane protein TerC [Sandaracinus amylolyticus]